ncbi:glycosyl hydrolase family 28-related protein [Nonomuraea typhae]|uniref:glycosyl hydrolase family 28-related protein n=1 Tax=Nonomuraea typhae TaxID=2603600 RepID=UPI0012F7955F|nr:glycosyl hydrolase family 28-related protein [Nonomuraea typhae]
MHETVTRRALLGAAAATAVLTGTAARADSPDGGRDRGRPQDDSAVLLGQWAQAPGAHPLVPDVSRAGYRLGARLPRGGRVVTRVTDHGARADGVTDCAPAFNAALKAAGQRGGGVVLVPPGTYLLNAPVFMHWSNVVLRGSGREATILHFARPLDDGYRQARQSNGNSRWSWTGGQVWFISPERRALSEAEDFAGTENWLVGETLATVAAATRGARTLMVSGTAGLRPGDMVILETENRPDAGLLKHVSGDVPGAAAYDWPRRAPQLVTGSGGQYIQYASFQWPVRVQEVLGPRLVRLAQPIRYDLRPEWPARLRAIGPVVHDSGLERLTVRNALAPMTAHNKHPGANGVCFQAVHDCWAFDVRVENCDLGFGFTTAKSNTLSRVSVGGRAAHHSFACRMQSHDNLVEDFEIEAFTVPVPAGAVHHGLNLEGLSSGNVWRRGTMAEGTFDTHRALPFENVRTDITLVNNGRVGGSGASGPLFGARIAHWNVRITSGSPYALTIGDVAPRSVSVGIQGANGTGSELTPDFAGDLESFTALHGAKPSVADLYAAQREIIDRH